MRFLKFLAVLTIALFTFFVAPNIQGLRAQEPQVLQSAELEPQAPSIFDLLNLAEKKGEPAPEVVCASDPKEKNDRCVPKYRFSDEVDGDSVKKATAWIDAANKAGADEILFEINTPGGGTDSGFELAKAIEDSEAPVTCVVDGEAASMGFYLLQSCEHRLITKRSSLMTHEPSLTGIMGGHPNDWQSIADMMRVSAETFAIHCAHRLKIGMKEYHSHVDGNKQWWMLADEAKKIGAVDSIVDSVKAARKAMLHRK